MRLEPETIRQRVKEWLNSGKNELPDELADVLKGAHDFAIDRRGVLERYLGGHVDLCLSFVRVEASGETHGYRAVVKHLVAADRPKTTVTSHETRGELHAKGPESERSMLVEVRQFSERPERVTLILNRPHLVRLEQIDDSDGLRGSASQPPALNSLVDESFGCFADGKLGARRGRSVTTDDEFVGDVFERRTQIGENVADAGRELQAWLSGDAEHQDGMAVRIAFSDEFVWTVIDVPSKVVIERYEVTVCPSQFLNDAR